MKKYISLFLFTLIPMTAVANTLQPFLDVLAWRAAESNTAWATTISAPTGATNVLQNNMSFHTRPGFKLGFSYLPDNHFWDTTLYWTHYETVSSKTIPLGAQAISSLFFSGNFFFSGDIFFGASANWQLQMNMVDLVVSHAFKPTRTLTVTPKIGLKGGSINQALNITWNAIIYNAREKVINNFTGVGPSFGVNGRWNFYGNFNAVADISTALMYGKWNSNDTYKRPLAFFGFITPTTISSSMNQSKLGTLMLDNYLGLEWIYQGRSRITLQLGYEMQYWASQLRLVTFQQLPILGDLTLQGATCGITIDL